MKTTALEILSEPLSLLVLLAALTLAVLAPAFHYHQFGDPTRMARDAGFSALLTCGSVIAVFCTIRSFRREIESGTLEMALAHPVSRAGCFLAKTAGAFLAYLILAKAVLGTTFVMFQGAAIGGMIAGKSGDIATIFGPCFAAGVGIIVLPLLIAAALNRFAHFRFVLSTVVLTVLLSLAGEVVSLSMAWRFLIRMAPVAVLIVLFSVLLLSAAAAFAIRLKANAAAAAVGAVFALFIPAIGNYYLVDALAKGGSLPWSYVGLAVAVTLPAVAAFLLVGVHFINGRDIQWTM